MKLKFVHAHTANGPGEFEYVWAENRNMVFISLYCPPDKAETLLKEPCNVFSDLFEKLINRKYVIGTDMNLDPHRDKLAYATLLSYIGPTKGCILLPDSPTRKFSVYTIDYFITNCLAIGSCSTLGFLESDHHAI